MGKPLLESMTRVLGAVGGARGGSSYRIVTSGAAVRRDAAEAHAGTCTCGCCSRMPIQASTANFLRPSRSSRVGALRFGRRPPPPVSLSCSMASASSAVGISRPARRPYFTSSSAMTRDCSRYCVAKRL
jgi:hypothetical protein